MKVVRAVGQADQHEAAAAQIARRRMRNRQREPHRYRRIHRIAARFQHRFPGIGGVAFARHHHGVLGAHRLPRFQHLRANQARKSA